MIPISKRLQKFPEYIFSKLAKEAKKVELEKNRKILDLSLGSPSFPPSKKYMDKLKEFIDTSGSHLYAGYGATAEFSQGIITWYKTRFNVDIKNDELFPLLGAKDGISHIVMALTDEGNEVLVPSPGWPGFTGPALMMGCAVVPYNLTEENDFKLPLDEIRRKITARTRMIWINFPSNPTGQVATLEELKPLVELCKEKNIWLLYDNAYAEVAYDGYLSPSILQIEGAKDIAIEVGSFSKMYSFAGFRMGWIVGNAHVIAALAKVKSQIDSGLSNPLQALSAYAFTNPDTIWHKKMISKYEQNKNKLIKVFTELGLTMRNPKGGLYLWAKIPDRYSDSYMYCRELLKTKHILVTPGIAFGANGDRHVRICFSSDITHLSEYI